MNTDAVTLADGGVVGVDLYEGFVLWDNQDRRVIVHCLEGAPLIGMSLFVDHLLTIAVVDGGRVTLDALP